MLSVSERIRDAGTVLALNARASFMSQTAFFVETWSNVLSTLVMTGVTIVFITVLFTRVTSIAGYGYGETLFLLLILELGRFVLWTWSYPNAASIIQDIRSGALDLTLVRPLPHLLYLHTRDIQFVVLLRDGAPSLIAITVLIPWASLHLQIGNVAAAAALFLLGQIAFNAVLGTMAYRAFWNPKASASFWDMAMVLIYGDPIPVEAFPRWFATLGTTIAPGLLIAAVPASVALGKLPALPTLALGIGVTLVLSWARVLAWRAGLREYSSASS